jgi:hypothetical protein
VIASPVLTWLGERRVSYTDTIFFATSWIKFKQNEQLQAQMQYSYFFKLSMLCFVCLTTVHGLLCKTVLRLFTCMVWFTITPGVPTSEDFNLTGNKGNTSMMEETSSSNDESRLFHHSFQITSDLNA